MRNMLVDTFLQECEDLLPEIEECALSLDGESDSAEVVGRLFRAFHTIKGSGAMVGLDHVASFTHHVETLLDGVREGKVAASPRIAELVLASADEIKRLLAVEPDSVPVASEGREALIAELEQFAQKSDSAPPSNNRHPEPQAGSAEEGHINSGQERSWQIVFRPNPDLFHSGGNPYLLIRELGMLGSVEAIALTEDVPSLEDLQPTTCYLGWNVTLRTAADENAIRDVFVFVEDGAELSITPIEYPQGYGTHKFNVAVSKGMTERFEQPIDLGPVSGRTQDEHSDLAAKPQAKTVSKESVVRVPSSRLDRLVNLVGELVMNQSRLLQAATLAGTPELANPVQEMERLVAELRDDVLSIRMLPIGTIFGRFRRLVHDLSADLGKEVDLVTEGAETELDKSILDQLSEPLVHLLRNSIDHGIETADRRIELGKPRRGTVRLSATHAGSHVVISIEDDGKGIDRRAVRAKAVDKKLIAPDAVLGESELLSLDSAARFFDRGQGDERFRPGRGNGRRKEADRRAARHVETLKPGRQGVEDFARPALDAGDHRGTYRRNRPGPVHCPHVRDHGKCRTGTSSTIAKERKKPGRGSGRTSALRRLTRSVLNRRRAARN